MDSSVFTNNFDLALPFLFFEDRHHSTPISWEAYALALTVALWVGDEAYADRPDAQKVLRRTGISHDEASAHFARVVHPTDDRGLGWNSWMLFLPPLTNQIGYHQAANP